MLTASPRRALDLGALLPPVLAAGSALLLLGLPWPQSLFLLLGGAMFLLALLAPRFALGLLVASVPFQATSKGHLGFIEVTVTQVILLSLAAAWGLRLLTERRPLRADWIAAAWGLHLLALIISVSGARNPAASVSELYRWASPLLVYLIAREVIRTTDDGRPAVAGMITGVSGAALVGIYQVVSGDGPPSFRLHGLIRAYATFGQPNPFAGYLGITVPLLLSVAAGGLLALIRQRTMGRQRWLVGAAALATGLGLVALLLTQSRGGWVGAGSGLAAVVWLRGGRFRWAAVLAGALALGVLMATPFGDRLADRFVSSWQQGGTQVQVTAQNFAVQERLAHWGAGIRMAERYPLFGVGAGNFNERFREFTPNWRFRESRGHAHNAYIQEAAEAGLVGLTTYLILCGAVGWRLWALLRRAPAGLRRDLVIGAIGVSLAFALHNVFDYLHGLSLPVQLVVVWALAAAASSDSAAASATGATRA